VFDTYFKDASPDDALAKFDRIGLDRIYDSGNISIYDVGSLWK
jgi:hypothetical protein